MQIKTHCKRNHEFTPENTWIGKTGKRTCRECTKLRRPLTKNEGEAKYGARYGSQRWQIEQLKSGECVVFVNTQPESMSGTLHRAKLIREDYTVRQCLIVNSELQTLEGTIVTRIK